MEEIKNTLHTAITAFENSDQDYCLRQLFHEGHLCPDDKELMDIFYTKKDFIKAKLHTAPHELADKDNHKFALEFLNELNDYIQFADFMINPEDD